METANSSPFPAIVRDMGPESWGTPRKGPGTRVWERDWVPSCFPRSPSVLNRLKTLPCLTLRMWVVRAFQFQVQFLNSIDAHIML